MQTYRVIWSTFLDCGRKPACQEKKNLHMHEGNVQTPHKKVPSGDWTEAFSPWGESATERGKQAFLTCATKLWNALPLSIRQASSLSIKKTKTHFYYKTLLCWSSFLFFFTLLCFYQCSCFTTLYLNVLLLNFCNFLIAAFIRLQFCCKGRCLTMVILKHQKQI